MAHCSLNHMQPRSKWAEQAGRTAAAAAWAPLVSSFKAHGTILGGVCMSCTAVQCFHALLSPAPWDLSCRLHGGVVAYLPCAGRQQAAVQQQGQSSSRAKGDAT